VSITCAVTELNRTFPTQLGHLHYDGKEYGKEEYEVSMSVKSQVLVERRGQSHKDIELLIESRKETLSLFGRLAEKRPFKANHDTQVLLQNFIESLIDYTASAHFQLYRHIDEDKERRAPVQEIAGKVYPRISDITQAFLEFNDKYDCEDHCDNLDELDNDLSQLGEKLADRIELEDRLIRIMRQPRTN
jgi:regulator of sigma D